MQRFLRLLCLFLLPLLPLHLHALSLVHHGHATFFRFVAGLAQVEGFPLPCTFVATEPVATDDVFVAVGAIVLQLDQQEIPFHVGHSCRQFLKHALALDGPHLESELDQSIGL